MTAISSAASPRAPPIISSYAQARIGQKCLRVIKLVCACVSARSATPTQAPRKATRCRRMRTRERRHSDTRTQGQEVGGVGPTQVA